MDDPDFVAWWPQHALSMFSKSIKNIALTAYVAGKKKGKDTEPPPDPTDDPADFSTGQSSLGIPGRDEET